MAELLIVVAIIVVLAAVAFIAVANYQRSMTQLEYDTIAKEIFIAAQNHLTTAESQGYLGLDETQFGTPSTFVDEDDRKDTEKEIYYIKYPNPGNAEDMRDLMLPFGSIDETIRTGGSYIIRYQPSSSTVLDVFFSYPGKTNMLGVEGKALVDDDYQALMEIRGDENKNERRNYNGAVVGWFGGMNALDIGDTLNTPILTVHNEEKLWVELNYAAKGVEGEKLVLILTGKTSDAKKAFSILPMPSAGEEESRVKSVGTDGKFQVILDDITNSLMHFANIASDIADKEFIPGENIEIEAVAYNNNALTNIAYSGKALTNSLFADLGVINAEGSTVTTASISNIRHLENLDYNISHVSHAEEINVNAAKQLTDLIWKKDDSADRDGFVDKIGGTNLKIYDMNNNAVAEDSYYPVSTYKEGNTVYPIDYDGNNHAISNIVVNTSGNAGIFGTLDKGSVSNLLVYGGTVNTSESNSAGGLIGEMKGTSVSKCASTAIVSSTSGAAGGLVGTADSSSIITSSYSGGHTLKGSYQKWIAQEEHSDVNGVTAGGLVGDSGAEISNSYSTCSVSGSTAGGFVGSSSGTNTNCYATGLIDMPFIDNDNKKIANKGAFAGSLTGSVTGCQYYSVINEVRKGDLHSSTIDHYLGPVGDDKNDGVTALDLNAETYNWFVGAATSWDSAKAYDSELSRYYSNGFPLRTVLQLPVLPVSTSTEKARSENKDIVATHYGDWPSPEVFFINTINS